MADTSRTPDSNQKEPLALDERTRRVLELRKQVREGRYRPDPRTVARAILAEWFAVGLELEQEEAMPTVTTSSDRRRVAERFIVEPTPVLEAKSGCEASA